MPNAGVWNYKYGALALAPGANQADVVAAAADPSDSYNFVWDAQTPKKMVTQSGLPPISSSRWNPDTGISTDTGDVLTMAFYKSLNAADTTAFASNGATVAVGMVFWPDSSTAGNKWTEEGNIEWVAETSTPAADGGSNSDSAMVLAQGFAAGAALLAAISF
jgi:hypothetical protein